MAAEDVNVFSSLTSALNAYKLHVNMSQKESNYLIPEGSSPIPFRKIYIQLLKAIATLYRSDDHDNRPDDEFVAELDGSLQESWPGLLSAMMGVLALEENDDSTDDYHVLMPQELKMTMKHLFGRVKGLALTWRAQYRLGSGLWEQVIKAPATSTNGIEALLEIIQHFDLPSGIQEYLFTATPSPLQVFCSGLESTSNTLRIQSLRTIAAQSKLWLCPDLVGYFLRAGLISHLAKCVRMERDWPIVAPLIATIMPSLLTRGMERVVAETFRLEMEEKDIDVPSRLRLAGAALYLWNVQLSTKVVQPSGSEAQKATIALPEDSISALVQYLISNQSKAPEKLQTIAEDDLQGAHTMLKDRIPAMGQEFVDALRLPVEE